MKSKVSFRHLVSASASAIVLSIAPIALAASLEKPLLDAVLVGDWQKVYDTLDNSDGTSTEPSARLLMGHACLATNRNNAATVFFLSANTGLDLERWAEWSTSLLQQQPKNPLALYLSGDAQARSGNLAAAKDRFTQAIQAKGNFALAYSARGVVEMLMNDADAALLDFAHATKLAPDLADAHANLGTLSILEENAQGAKEAFSRAIELSPQFALAYNGLGCAHFGEGKLDEASQDFYLASQYNPLLAIPEVNRGLALAYGIGLLTLAETVGKAGQDTKPGTLLQSRATYSPQQKQTSSASAKRITNPSLEEKLKAVIAMSPEARVSSLKALVDEHGIANVQMATAGLKTTLAGKIGEINAKVQSQRPSIDRYSNGILALQVADTVISLVSAGTGTIRDFGKARALARDTSNPALEAQYLGLRAEARVEKAGLAAAVRNQVLSRIISIVPTDSDPRSWGAAGVRTLIAVGQSNLTARRAKALSNMTALSLETVVGAAQMGSLNEVGKQLADLAPTQERAGDRGPERQGRASVPRFYTTTARPLDEILPLTRMITERVNASRASSATALIVSRLGSDDWRAELLMTKLNLSGVQTRMVSSTSDVSERIELTHPGAVVGVRQEFSGGGNAKDRLPFNSERPISALTRVGPPDEGRAPGPPPPSLPVGPRASKDASLIRENWGWGKPYVVGNSDGKPGEKVGGIDMRPLANTYADKGNWPVRTTFGLHYAGAQSGVREGMGAKK